MTITYTKSGNITTHYHDGVKKYEHFKNSNGYEWWREYKDGYEVHYKNSDGFEWWREYKDGKEVHYKDSDGFEWWREYKDGYEVHYKDSDGYESWSDDHPDNPKNKITDSEPFTFG